MESFVLIERIELVGQLKSVFGHMCVGSCVRRQLRHVTQPRSEVDQRPEVVARLAGKIFCDIFGGESIEILRQVFRRSTEFGEDVARAADGVFRTRACLALNFSASSKSKAMIEVRVYLSRK